MSFTAVSIKYEELKSDVDLSNKLELAFGVDGIGLLTISGVPGFVELRQKLLPLAARIAQLSAAAKAELEDADSRWSFGWSEGRERLQDGVCDTNKGSFYANPLLDSPSDDPALAASFPAYCRPNLWPGKQLPELEVAFKALGRLICQVGYLLATHCDRYLTTRGVVPLRSLHDTLTQSPCPKGRLLHYFPPAVGSSIAGQENWCAWHRDHGSLTGLTSAMFLDRELQEVPVPPDPAAGLYARARAGLEVRAAIPPDHIAFQVGEALQVQSGGLLRATPHCVVAPRIQAAAVTSRNTFAVFLQPRWDEVMAVPEGMDPSQAEVGHWTPGMSFGEFSERTVQDNYQ